MIVLTLPLFLGEVRGWTKLYNDVGDYGWAYLVFSVPFFLLFTDYCIYWIHRWLHIPALYKRIHKPHHKWISACHLGFAHKTLHLLFRCSPYALCVARIPSCRWLCAVHTVPPLHPPVPDAASPLPRDVCHRQLLEHLRAYQVDFLTRLTRRSRCPFQIHDSDMITGHPLEHVINGPAHHTLHHLYFVCNYGQYFTLADRAGGSYRHPQSSLDPLLEVKAREGLSAEEHARERREKEQAGDDIAEAWEREVLGTGKAKEE